MQTLTIGVEGMSCGSCVSSLTKVPTAEDGPKAADQSLDNKCATVTFDPA